MHNSSINEHKKMKLTENICYQIMNWILHYCFLGKNLQMKTNEFFLKNYFLKKGKILMIFGKKIKCKVVIRIHYCLAEIDIPPKTALQPKFFIWYPFSLMLSIYYLKDKYNYHYQLWNTTRKINKTIFSSMFQDQMFIFFKVIRYYRIKVKKK